MGFSKLFSLSTGSSSSSNPTSSRSRGLDPSQLGPGSSKADYAFGLNESSSPTTYFNPEDAPPAYSPKDSKFSTDLKMPPPDKIQPDTFSSSDPTSSSSSREDPLAILKNRDIVIVLDDSHSMTIADNRGGKTRWEQAWDALTILVQRGIKYDKDGIKICFLNRQEDNTTIKSGEDLKGLRDRTPLPQPGTYTPTGQVLDDLLSEYMGMTASGPKKRIFLVITDGAATDDPKDPIIHAAKFYQKRGSPLDQVGIQFVQVGNDSQARKWLDELDTDLKKEMGENARDIVDTIKSTGADLTGDALVKALTGGINRKQDRAGEK